MRTAKDSRDDRVPGLAAEVALFTLVSLPALVLVVLGSLGYVADSLGPAGWAELERLVVAVPKAAMSDSTFGAYESLVRPVLAGGRIDVIGVGLLLGLWTGPRGDESGAGDHHDRLRPAATSAGILVPPAPGAGPQRQVDWSARSRSCPWWCSVRANCGRWPPTGSPT